MATIQELNRRQTYLLHAINWIENASGLNATVVSADFESGAVAVFGKDASRYRAKLRNIMRRVNE